MLENLMTLSETQEVVQLVLSGTADLPNAISRTIQARPKFDRKFVFVGALTDRTLLDSLSAKTQSERDTLLSGLLEQLLPSGVQYTSRLGKTKFIVTGSEDLQSVFRRLPKGFEFELNRLLATEIVG